MKFKKVLIQSLVAIPWILLIAFSLWYFEAPTRPSLIYPIFLALLLWLYGAHEALLDSPSLPWIVALDVVLIPFAFLHPARHGRAESLSLAAQWALIGIALAAVSQVFRKVQQEALGCQNKIDELTESLKSKVKENNFYQAKITLLKSQIGERKKLAAYAREMGTLLDPALIRQTLIEKTHQIFPQEQVHLRAALGEDPVDVWVEDRKNAILIKDIDQDNRMASMGIQKPVKTSAKSVIAAPILVSRKMMGLLRVDSKSPGRFSENDLQKLEVYASLATLALENAQLFSEVNAMATRDGLTGLATHRVFQERLTEELLRGARYRTPVSLIMADIDHFKSVNDGYGHLAGDAVLKEVSQILLSRLRPVDLAARYGGEEFCLILPGFSGIQTQELAEKLRSEIESRMINVPGNALKVTASFGCSIFPEDAQVASQLLRTADERLYRAKKDGRNRVIGR